MKRIVLFIVGLLFAFPMVAQNQSDQELAFIYIAHDENTDTQALVRRLKTKYQNTINYPEMRATIFYLPNGENPIVVYVNLPNDNRRQFDEILSSLQQKRAHDVRPEDDVDRIQEIFNEYDIEDQNGNPTFRSVEWTYYINSTFWQLQGNEQVVAKLFFVMDMERLIQSGYLRLDFLYSEQGDTIPYNPEKPFGAKDLCRSIEFMPLPY